MVASKNKEKQGINNMHTLQAITIWTCL